MASFRTDDADTEVKDFDVTKVVKVYSGRAGCMCGCMGTYHYAADKDLPGLVPKAAKKLDASVKRVANNMKKWAAEHGEPMFMDVSDNCVYIMDKEANKYYAAWLK
jgi:hypothetical protein